MTMALFFEHPKSLAALLLVPLLILYILFWHRRGQEQIVPWLKLWEEAALRVSFPERLLSLRQLLSQLCLLLAIACGILAASGPRRLVASTAESEVILILDASPSMNTLEANGRSRFEAAKSLAFGLIRNKGPREWWTVALAAEGLRPLAPPSLHVERLQDAMVRGKTTYEPARLERAVHQAQDGDHDRRVIVISDFSSKEDQSLLDHSREGIYLIPLGAALENCGFVEATLMAREGRPRVLLGIENFGSQEQAVEIETTLDGVSLGAFTLTLAAGKRETKEIEIPAPRGLLRVSLRAPADRLSLDNEISLVLSERTFPPIAVLTDQAEVNPYVAALLETLQEWFPESYRLRSVQDLKAAAGERRLLVLSETASLADPLPSSDYLFFGVSSPLAVLETQREVSFPPIEDWERRHPLTAGLTFHDLSIESTTILVPREGDSILLRTNHGSIAVAGERPFGRFVALGFGLTESNFALVASFPLFIKNALSWLADHEAVVKPSYTVGEKIVPLEGTSPLRVRPGERRVVPREGGLRAVEVGPCGIERAGVQFDTFINWIDPEESRIVPGRPEASLAPWPGPLWEQQSDSLEMPLLLLGLSALGGAALLGTGVGMRRKTPT